MRLATQTHGDGPRRIALVHGLSADGALWRGLTERIVAAGGATVTTVDLRGHGASDRSEVYTVDAFADDLVETLPTGPRPGRRALPRWLGARAGRRPARTGPRALPRSRLPAEAPHRGPRRAPVLGRRPGDAYRRGAGPEASQPRPPSAGAAGRALRDAALARFDRRMTIGVFRDVAHHPAPVAAPVVPSTIVLSDDSPAVLPDATAERLAELGWEVRRLPGVGHDFWLEDADRTVDEAAPEPGAGHGTDRDPTPTPRRTPSDAAPDARPPLRRMSFGLLMVYVAILAVNSGGNGILLPNIVAGIDEAGKVGNLAFVTTVAFIANIFAQPVAGRPVRRDPLALRPPYALDGGRRPADQRLPPRPADGAVGARRRAGVARRPGRRQRPPGRRDRHRPRPLPRGPPGRRLGDDRRRHHDRQRGRRRSSPAAPPRRGLLPYAVLSVLVLAIVGFFVVVNRDEPSTHLPRERSTAKEFLRGFWVSPRQHPDFAWAFVSRFLMVIGFYGAQTYGLYILRDYIGLSDAESNSFAATMGVVLLVGVLLSAIGSGWLSDKVGRRKPFIVWSSIVMSIALAVPLFVPTTTGVLAYAFLLGLGFGVYISIDLALMTEVLPARLAGRGQRRPRPGHPRPGHDRCRRR